MFPNSKVFNHIFKNSSDYTYSIQETAHIKKMYSLTRLVVLNVLCNFNTFKKN